MLVLGFLFMKMNSLALVLHFDAVIGTVEKFPVEKLHSNDSENELEENVYYKDIEDIFK